MSMTKEQAQQARREAGQHDAVLGQNVVGRQIRGSLDYFGTEGEFKLTTSASPTEILQPGFLDPAIEKNPSYKGAIIHVVAKSGSEDPADWSVGMIMVVAIKGMAVKNNRGEIVRDDKNRPMHHQTSLVGLLQNFKKPTVVDDRTHDAPAASNGEDTAPRQRKRLSK